MKVTLAKIDGLESRYETVWKIRSLKIEDRDPAARALLDWKRKDKKAHKAVMKIMRLCGVNHRIQNPHHVKKVSENIYEMIAYTDIARVMFFYDDEDDTIIVCTNCHDKRQGSQNAAIQRGEELRNLYLKHYARPRRAD